MDNFKSPTCLDKKSSINEINETIKADSNVTIWKSAKFDNMPFFDISEMTLNDPTLLSNSSNNLTGNSSSKPDFK